jgi:hypothetical protein
MLEAAGPAGQAILAEAAISPEQVADTVAEALGDGRVLLLPPPEVAQMYAGRAADPDHWLAGMRRLRQHVDEALAGGEG